MKFLISFSLLALLASSLAFAGGKKRSYSYPATSGQNTTVNVSNNIALPTAATYEATAGKVENAADVFLRSLNKSDTEFSSSLDALSFEISRANALASSVEQAQAKYDQEFAKTGASVARLDDQISTLEKQSLGGKASSEVLTRLTALTKERDTIGATLKAYKEDLTNLKTSQVDSIARTDKIRDSIRTSYGKYLDGATNDLKNANDIQSLKNAYAKNARADKIMQAFQLTNDLFQRNQMDYLKTGILFSDLAQLQSQYNLTEDQLAILSDVAADKMQNTLMGKIICKMKDKCSKTTTTSTSTSTTNTGSLYQPENDPKSATAAQ